ncbi:diguanylate cyclase [Devosia sp.]|uniref:GGDEF domain-containing protein n=1 Tax=Devosia sp. TaxID=1871048 RepID=UPI001AFD5660|nr:GGDEF domain-containing protein [Devosia sp.]MBO9588064.1 diguanylate cyclase [Devosia sp.]
MQDIFGTSTMVHGQLFFALINPIIALLFSLGFGLIWLRWRSYKHLVVLSLAFLCLGLGFIFYDFKILVWPAEINVGANILYVATITLACASTFLRKNLPPPVLIYLAITASGALPFIWYLLVEPSTLARILITSAIFAGVTIVTFVGLVRQPERTLADNLFAAAVGLAFFVAVFRPALVLTGVLHIESSEGFTASDYWTSIRAFTPLMSFIVAALYSVAIGLDVVSHLKGQADRDYLTGLLNRRGFETAGDEAVARDFANSRQPAMLVADIDDFKKVNDTFGHKVGDAVIVAVARTLARHGDAVLAARTGGEEFALYYNDIDRAELQGIARKIRSALAQMTIAGLPNNYPVTLSVGLHLSYSQESLADMMTLADQALYRAKSGGKDQAVMTPVRLHLASGSRLQSGDRP